MHQQLRNVTQSPATLITSVVAAACLFWCLAMAALDNGVDAANLGKGNWLWVLSDCESNIGAPGNLQALIDFERARGMRWLVVKSSDGGQVWSQFNSDLVTRCHNAGLKVFSFGYVYGGSSSQVQYEINAAVTAMGIKDSHNVPMDGFIIDAEIEFNAAGQDAYAAQYCQGVRAQVPQPFPGSFALSHSQLEYFRRGVSVRDFRQVLRCGDAAGLLV